MKQKVLLLVVLLVFLVSSAASALTLAWDPYDDPDATALRIESCTVDCGTDSNWSELVGGIATTFVASDVPNGTDYTRVYYRMKAYNSTDTSLPSNVVSFYWSTGGGGYEGLATPGAIRLLDCDQILQDTNHADYPVCTGRNTQ